jgi:hypothetical protein
MYSQCMSGFFIVVDDAIWEGYGSSVVFPNDANV